MHNKSITADTTDWARTQTVCWVQMQEAPTTALLVWDDTVMAWWSPVFNHCVRHHCKLVPMSIHWPACAQHNVLKCTGTMACYLSFAVKQLCKVPSDTANNNLLSLHAKTDDSIQWKLHSTQSHTCCHATAGMDAGCHDEYHEFTQVYMCTQKCTWYRSVKVYE